VFGFKAFAEAPIAAEKEQAQAQSYVGAIGVSAIGVHAIGRVTTQTVEAGNVDVTASAAGVTVTVNNPAATAGIAITASASGVTLTLSDPAATAKGGATIAVDGHKARQTFTVTVSNDGSGNKYYIDGVKQDSLSLHEVGIYRFDVSDSTISGHPFKFSTTSDGTHNSGTEYTTNVTTVGTAGNAGAYVEIEVTTSTPDLYYYCGIHSGMGGSITFVEDFSQVPFVIERSLPVASANAGAITQVQAATIGLTAAEASVLAGATATFSDSIEVGLTAPVSSASASKTVTISDNLSITVTAPDQDIRVRTLSTYAGRVDRFTTKHNFNFPTVNLSFPTTFTLSSGTGAGSWTVNSYTTINKRLIDWDSQRALVWFDGKKSTDSSNNSWMATWEFDLSGNLTIIRVDAFMQWANFGIYADYVDALRGSSFIDGDLEIHPAASGDVQMITPAVSFQTSGTYSGTYLYVNVRAISWNASVSHINTNSLLYSNWAPAKVSSRTDYSDVTIFPINIGSGTPQEWPPARTVLPWRGDWGSRSRQNYLVWPITVNAKYYLYLAAENGDLISVYSDTSASPSAALFRAEAKKFADGTYANYCIGDSTDDFIWFHDDSTEYKDKAEKYLSLSEPVQTFDTDMEVDITDSALQVAELTTTITAPDGIAVEDVTASAAGVTVSISAPSVANTVETVASASGATISVNAPTVLVTVDDTATASGVNIPLTSPAVDASGGAIAQAAGSTVSISSPVVDVNGGARAQAAGDVIDVLSPAVDANGGARTQATGSTVSISSPVVNAKGGATAQAAGDVIDVSSPAVDVNGGAVAEATGETIIISSPVTNAGSSNTAQATGSTVSISSPAVDANGGARAQAAGDVIDVSSPVVDVNGGAVAEATGSTITVSSPVIDADVDDTATASGATVSVSAPSVSASVAATATGTLPTVSVIDPDVVVSTDAETADITGTSTVSGTFVLIKNVAASVTGTASVSGDASFVISESGSVATTATVSGEGTTLQGIEGSIAGSSTTSASLIRLKDAAGSSTGSTNLSASCTIVKDVGSTVSGTATASGSIETYLVFSGSTEATASTSASSSFVFGFTGTVESSATLAASAFVTRPLIAEDISPFRTITIPADPPSVVTVHSDTIRYALIFPERRRYIRIVS